jgi:nucleotide-binding universal stress UspA family protein
VPGPARGPPRPGAALVNAHIVVGVEGGALVEALGALERSVEEQVFDALVDRPIAWTFDVRTGDAAHVLIAEVTRVSGWVIVVGGRPHSRLGGLVASSVAGKLVRHSPVSVIVARQARAASPVRGGE